MPSALARLGFELAIRLALASSDKVIAVSKATKEDLIKFYHVPQEKIAVTYLAADERFRPRSEDEVAAMRRKYGLPARYVLYFGINKPHKNLVRLIEAWSLVIGLFSRSHVYLRQRKVFTWDSLDFGRKNWSLGFDHWSLVIAGAWDERYPEPIERAEALGITESVRFLGPVPEEDLPALYSGATLFVFPSLWEGFGLPVLEAMACGVPVACSKTSSLPEIVGDAALMFDPSDVEGMALTIRRALEDEALRAEIGEKGLQRAAQFSWNDMAITTLKVYSESAEISAR
jgi:alpha-1,3-rhamnosyl/mannosyltransferase